MFMTFSDEYIIYLLIYISIILHVYLSVDQSIDLWIHLSIDPSIYLSIYLSFHLCPKNKCIHDYACLYIVSMATSRMSPPSFSTEHRGVDVKESTDAAW